MVKKARRLPLFLAAACNDDGSLTVGPILSRLGEDALVRVARRCDSAAAGGLMCRAHRRMGLAVEQAACDGEGPHSCSNCSKHASSPSGGEGHACAECDSATCGACRARAWCAQSRHDAEDAAGCPRCLGPSAPRCTCCPACGRPLCGACEVDSCERCGLSMCEDCAEDLLVSCADGVRCVAPCG